MTAVFVTGASGFIAQHIVQLLLDKKYSVCGTVRTRAQGERLRRNFDSDKFSFEVVADIGRPDALKEALERHPEVTVFLHTASPFTFKVEDVERDLLLPAVNGTKNAMLAVVKYAPQVKQVVVTSSYAALALAAAEMDPLATISELTWNDADWDSAKKNAVAGYFGSKKFAEEAAWDFFRQNRAQINFDLNCVLPLYVFGPQAFDENVEGRATLNTSLEIINRIVKLKTNDRLPNYFGSFIDVRDVAMAHLLAFERADILQERLLLANGRFVTQDILDIVNKKFPTLQGRIPRGSPGTGAAANAKLAKVDNTRTRNLLKFEFMPLEQSVVDLVFQLQSANAEREQKL